jgi:hypothetical protein
MSENLILKPDGNASALLLELSNPIPCFSFILDRKSLRDLRELEYPSNEFKYLRDLRELEYPSNEFKYLRDLQDLEYPSNEFKYLKDLRDLEYPSNEFANIKSTLPRSVPIFLSPTSCMPRQPV